MLIYNQEINNYIFDLEHFDVKYFEGEYFEVFKKFISDKNCYGLYRDDDTWNVIDKILIKSSITLIPINYTDYESPFHPILEMDLKILQTMFFTERQANVIRAHSIHLSTLLFTNDQSELDRSKLPDCYINSPETLELFFTGKLRGYFNELLTCNYNFELGTINTFNLSHALNNDIKTKLISGGRYFTSADTRFHIHPLTKKILAFKDGLGEGIGNQLSTILRSNLSFVKKHQGDFNLITSVPAKPESIDRISILLNNENLAEFRQFVDCNILYVNSSYKQQKDAGDWDSRAANVNGVFSIKKEISGHVILVDDIVTSGSTAMECVRMLEEAGAEKVTIIALASMQSRVESNSELHISCNDTSCEGDLKLRFNSRDASPFFGCGKYPECRMTLPFLCGCAKISLRERLRTE